MHTVIPHVIAVGSATGGYTPPNLRSMLQSEVIMELPTAPLSAIPCAIMCLLGVVNELLTLRDLNELLTLRDLTCASVDLPCPVTMSSARSSVEEKPSRAPSPAEGLQTPALGQELRFPGLLVWTAVSRQGLGPRAK